MYTEEYEAIDMNAKHDDIFVKWVWNESSTGGYHSMQICRIKKVSCSKKMYNWFFLLIKKIW